MGPQIKEYIHIKGVRRRCWHVPASMYEINRLLALLAVSHYHREDNLTVADRLDENLQQGSLQGMAFR